MRERDARGSGVLSCHVGLTRLSVCQDVEDEPHPSSSEEKKKIPDPDSEDVSEVDVRHIIE